MGVLVQTQKSNSINRKPLHPGTSNMENTEQERISQGNQRQNATARYLYSNSSLTTPVRTREIGF
jgi:hypothetical protein